VKLIRPELLGARDPEEAAALVARFRREAEATAALRSAHTVALHDFGVTPEGAFYYVMELLEGLDLETLVRRHGAVTPERAAHLLLQACESLGEAHALGLVHRDVKPSNMVVGRWGRAGDFLKVLDFGLVRASVGDEASDPEVAGTPAFMAPEVALRSREVDERADVYGLGCVAYWLLTGERVFPGATAREVLEHHVSTTPEPPSSRSESPIPAALEELVMSCLAKDPKARPESAWGVAERLAATGLAAAWTETQARAWWEKAEPGATRTSSRA
jgi:serine/threonine-protein kinase